jgi:hypothetical protein
MRLERCYREPVKRIVVSLALGYVTLALLGRAAEAAGLRSCGCNPDCWCKKPGLSVFRWVFPRFHRSAGLAEWEKGQLDT